MKAQALVSRGDSADRWPGFKPSSVSQASHFASCTSVSSPLEWGHNSTHFRELLRGWADQPAEGLPQCLHIAHVGYILKVRETLDFCSELDGKDPLCHTERPWIDSGQGRPVRVGMATTQSLPM